MSIAAGCAGATTAADVCPARPGYALRYVDVFDGDPDERANLVPEETTETQGHWELGYIYDQGRAVTVRCKYTDTNTHDIRLSKRVSRCSYSVSENVLDFGCR